MSCRVIRKKTARGTSRRRRSAATAGMLCTLVLLSVFPEAARAEKCKNCGFLFCEPEPWISWQNSIHFTTTYALHVTATEINNSPRKNFLWISALGVGIEVFQGACLDHPLHGGFSYKNVVFNELGLLTGVAVHKLIMDRGKRNPHGDRSYGSQSPQARAFSVPLLAQYVDGCDCRWKPPVQAGQGTAQSLRPGLAGLLRPGLHSRYNVGTYLRLDHLHKANAPHLQ
jgi:hypothetical protein